MDSKPSIRTATIDKAYDSVAQVQVRGNTVETKPSCKFNLLIAYARVQCKIDASGMTATLKWSALGCD